METSNLKFVIQVVIALMKIRGSQREGKSTMKSTRNRKKKDGDNKGEVSTKKNKCKSRRN